MLVAQDTQHYCCPFFFLVFQQLLHLVGIVDKVASQDDQGVDFLLEVDEPRDVVRVRSRGIELLRLEVLQRRLEDFLWPLRTRQMKRQIWSWCILGLHSSTSPAKFKVLQLRANLMFPLE